MMMVVLGGNDGDYNGVDGVCSHEDDDGDDDVY